VSPAVLSLVSHYPANYDFLLLFLLFLIVIFAIRCVRVKIFHLPIILGFILPVIVQDSLAVVATNACEVRFSLAHLL